MCTWGGYCGTIRQFYWPLNNACWGDIGENWMNSKWIRPNCNWECEVRSVTWFKCHHKTLLEFPLWPLLWLLTLPSLLQVALKLCKLRGLLVFFWYSQLKPPTLQPLWSSRVPVQKRLFMNVCVCSYAFVLYVCLYVCMPVCVCICAAECRQWLGCLPHAQGEVQSGSPVIMLLCLSLALLW